MKEVVWAPKGVHDWEMEAVPTVWLGCTAWLDKETMIVTGHIGY